jgi:hypothetical protein
MSNEQQQSKSQGPPKLGTVVKIISSDTVALSFGKKQGATVGTRYRIVHPIEINDPDNEDRVLERIAFTKAIVEVIQVFQHVSIAKPPVRTIRKVLPSPLDKWSGKIEEEVVRDELNVSRQDIAFTEADRQIHVRDPVHLTVE